MSLLLFYELSFQILPEDQRRLRAIELSVPSTVATFQVKHRNSYGIVTDARVYNIDLNSGGFPMKMKKTVPIPLNNFKYSSETYI